VILKRLFCDWGKLNHQSLFRNSSGSLAIFAAIRRAWSLESNLAAACRPGSFS
jgi:hypothetical protein